MKRVRIVGNSNNDQISYSAETNELDRFEKVMDRERYDIGSFGYQFMKRAFDIAFSFSIILNGLIPGVLLSVVIMLDTKGSQIYSRMRVGEFGKQFYI